MKTMDSNGAGDAYAAVSDDIVEAMGRETALARGLPVGADLDLADRVTLSHAFAGRSSL